MIWHSKHQVSNQIEENYIFLKNWMFQFVKSNGPVFS
jgi:hypothetical protein